MSTLKCTTISKQDGSASVPTDTVVNGTAKAWVFFTVPAGTPTIQASFNVTSITDGGVGDFTVNFTVAFADANYGYGVAINAAAGGSGYGLAWQSGTKSTTQCRFVNQAPSNGSVVDPTSLTAAFYR